MNDAQLNALVWFAVFSAAGWVALVKGLRRRRASMDREEREKAPRSGGGLMLAGVCWIVICALLATGASTLRGRAGMELRRAVRGLRITDFTRIFRRSGSGDGDSRDGDYRYTPDGKYFAVVTAYTGSEERVSVPFMLGERVVNGLAPGAYSRCDTLVYVTVPAVIHDIPAACFTACVRLQEVELREGVQSIQTHAFDMCPSLKRVALPASLERIADDAFPDGCKARFEVIGGSAAERYCRDKGFEYESSPAE